MLNEFKKTITGKSGLIISEATHRNEDLLSATYDILNKFGLNLPLQAEIFEIFTEEPTSFNVFYGYTSIPDEKQEEATQLFNEDVYSYFNEIAPNGYYFGTSEGDASCFGWFLQECELAPDTYEATVATNVIIKISGKEVTIAIHVNEEGNLVLDGIGSCLYEMCDEELVLMRL